MQTRANVEPDNVEALRVVREPYIKPISWRKMSTIFGRFDDSPAILGLDRWDELMAKVQGVQVLGPGIIELLQIAARYERQQTKQVSLTWANNPRH